jgi:hypothetical protein
MNRTNESVTLEAHGNGWIVRALAGIGDARQSFHCASEEMARKLYDLFAGAETSAGGRARAASR